MAHDHNHSHHHNDESNIKVAFFLNIIFAFIEIIGGIFTNSMAILSNAVHDLGDSLSLGLAWYFQNISKKESNTSYSYGYKRFSLLGAIINSIVLIVGSTIILSAAIPRIFHPQHTELKGMVLLAIVGVIVNGAAAFRLKKGDSINEKVVSLHLLEDVLGWMAVMIGSVVMYYFDMPIIDSIMSIGIACFVLYNVYKNIGKSLKIILQGIPSEFDINEISTILHQINGIENVHDLHIWSIDGNYNILTVHIVITKNLTMLQLAELKEEIRTKLNEKSIQHVTIEFETVDEKCIFEKCC